MRPEQLSLLSTGLDSSGVDRLLSRSDDLNTSSTLVLDEEEDLQQLYVFGENLSGQLGLAHQRSNVLLPAVSKYESYELIPINLCLSLPVLIMQFANCDKPNLHCFLFPAV